MHFIGWQGPTTSAERLGYRVPVAVTAAQEATLNKSKKCHNSLLLKVVREFSFKRAFETENRTGCCSFTPPHCALSAHRYHSEQRCACPKQLIMQQLFRISDSVHSFPLAVKRSSAVQRSCAQIQLFCCYSNGVSLKRVYTIFKKYSLRELHLCSVAAGQSAQHEVRHFVGGRGPPRSISV